MKPEDITLNTDTINKTGDVIHGAIFESRPDIGAIMHTHTDAIVAVSCLPGGLKCYAQDSGMFWKRVGYHEYEGISEDYDECIRIQNSFPAPNHTLIMKNHGATTTGKDIGEAWLRMYYLDRACRVQLNIMNLGGVSIDDNELDKLLDQYEGSCALGIQNEWECQLRRVKRINPI
jgi:ribulose-5-phosphate 4-epimerase/fuculose-1-phosphate aldolase